jgi:hypothetical protein
LKEEKKKPLSPITLARNIQRTHICSSSSSSLSFYSGIKHIQQSMKKKVTEATDFAILRRQ